MDRERKERLIYEIAEFQDIIDSAGLNIDGMAKGFIILALTQETYTELKDEEARESLKGVITKAVPLTPAHCPYMEKLAYDKQLTVWSADCSVTKLGCPVQEYGLGRYADCLHYRGQMVSQAKANGEHIVRF